MKGNIFFKLTFILKKHLFHDFFLWCRNVALILICHVHVTWSTAAWKNFPTCLVRVNLRRFVLLDQIGSSFGLRE